MTLNYAEAYGFYHTVSGGKYFPGDARPGRGANSDEVVDLVELMHPTRMLDYGCGKGYHYLRDRIHERWGGLLPHCYDPGVSHLSRKPDGKFGGIICAGVMEHIDEDDVDSVLTDIFSYADAWAFVFLFISCKPAKSKRLPDGRNVHLTVQPPEWWEAKLAPFQREGLVIKTQYTGVATESN